ncbi:allophanate hydrolase [Hoyosella sp. YIM 151337]|uniref:allophanate hydrolase n=1 Tax=Hoyosella sp. YIM 151337 TaxID=2992742 RepID=UPI002235A9F2|nr:allophanate hydrolase [Hoyosella sp. YIM 151337]MCW4353354.1 allophanate hydrolase [Hoyosella sp. YIM 151337]
MTPTPAQRVRRSYARIAEAGRPDIWIHLRPVDDVLREAETVDPDLPLAGTVFAVKDNIDVAGLPTTAACPEFAYTPAQSATSVQRLIDAGAIVIGKTNMDQFATGLVGTRSPYGACRNAHHPERIAGGSSSGSAVAVALGITDFALGTDTAGSGRVPAALNAIFGMKATVGLIPVDGVVPACPSYDCVTTFAPALSDTVRVMRAMAGPSPTDPAAREWPANAPLAAPPTPRIAIPAPHNLAALSPTALAAFEVAVNRLEAAGAAITELDITEFLDAAKLLYEGALVAERYASFGDFVTRDNVTADPAVKRIARSAKAVSGAALVRDQQRLRELKQRTRLLLDDTDALLVPTAPAHPTLAEVAADPLGVNAMMGTFTNFLNLLDMAAVAVPAGTADGGLFGVSVVTRAFADQVAIDIAAMLTSTQSELFVSSGTDVAVFGAHMRGFPLNHEIVRAGGRFRADVSTAPSYRMFALPGPVPKPAVVRSAGGTSLAGELWRLPDAGLGAFLAALPRPMTLGKVELQTGEWVVGFGCSDPAGEDISSYGGWAAYRAALSPAT